MKIYFLSPNANKIVTNEVLDRLKQFGEIIVDEKPQPLSVITSTDSSEEKIIALDPDYCEWSVPKEEIDKLVNVRAICLQSTSFSWLDIEAAKTKGIAVMNVRNYSTEAVAEWALMMALNVARKVPMIVKNDWVGDFSLHQGIEFKNRVVGVVGLGNIGKRIAELCQGMGMKVIYWSKNSNDDRFEKVELNKLFLTADLVFPCLAQNEETKNYITDEMLKSMKVETIFASIVHKIYNHDLLLQLVKENKIYGYAYETSKSGEEMLKVEGNVWAGPEQAWTTKESLARDIEIWTQNIVKAAQDNFEFRVN